MQLWEACEAAGEAHLKAVGEHDSSSGDEGDELMPGVGSTGSGSKDVKV